MPGRKRYVHIDQSLSGDSTGISCCYLEDYKITEEETIDLYVRIEWMLRINPPKPPYKISLSNVRSLIPWLSKNKGVRFGLITYDTYQSADAIQELTKAGFNVATQSVDRTDEAYLLLVEYIYRNRIKFQRNNIFESELFRLLHDRARHKVDHPSDGTKDLADSVAGALYNLLKDEHLLDFSIERDINIILSI